jgi:hypothetical protein
MSLLAPCELIDWVWLALWVQLWAPLNRSFANQEFYWLAPHGKGDWYLVIGMGNDSSLPGQSKQLAGESATYIRRVSAAKTVFRRHQALYSRTEMMIYSLVLMVSCVVKTLGCVDMSAYIVRSYDVVLVSQPKILNSGNARSWSPTLLAVSSSS